MTVILLPRLHKREPQMSATNLRKKVSDILGVTNNSKEARAIYLLVDQIDALERENQQLKSRIQPTDAVGRGR